LYFTKSIAALSRNYFLIYSGDALFKLLRRESELHGDPREDAHTITTGLPAWSGTVVGIDISVTGGRHFAELLDEIRQSYTLGVKTKRKAYYRKIRFVS